MGSSNCSKSVVELIHGLLLVELETVVVPLTDVTQTHTLLDPMTPSLGRNQPAIWKKSISRNGLGLLYRDETTRTSACVRIRVIDVYVIACCTCHSSLPQLYIAYSYFEACLDSALAPNIAQLHIKVQLFVHVKCNMMT